MKPASCTGVGGVMTAAPKPASSVIGTRRPARPSAAERYAASTTATAARPSAAVTDGARSPRMAARSSSSGELVVVGQRDPLALAVDAARSVSGVRVSRWSVPSVPTTVSCWSGPGRDDQLAWIVPIAPPREPHEQLRVGLDVAAPAVRGAPTTATMSSPVT